MKSIDSHIKLIEQIKKHPKLNDTIKQDLTPYNSLLSMDYIAHYGEIINCLRFSYNNSICSIGVGYLFDKERTYAVYRIDHGKTQIICSSVDHLIHELNSMISLSLPKNRSIHTSNITSSKTQRDTQEYIENRYNYGSYTTYIRKQVEAVLRDEYDLSFYYNRKLDSIRHLQFVKARTKAIPHQLLELSYKLPIRPYIQNGWIGIAFNEVEL